MTSSDGGGKNLPWKARVEEPANRFVYYPIAKVIAAKLVPTSITPNQVTLVQPLIAAAAGYLITFNDWRYLIAGALVFEFRSLLDCVDGTLARAKKLASPNGHALDALCDWLSVVFLYIGVYLHFRLHPPAAGAWSEYLPMGGIIALSLLQGAVRSFAADYYLRKFGSILATGRDETVEDLRDKVRALRSDSPLMARVEAWIGRSQHLAIQHEVFDADRTLSIAGEQARALNERRNSPAMKAMAFIWSISSGDAFIRYTVLSLFAGHAGMWHLQLFMATAGIVWILALLWFSGSFMKRMALAPSEESLHGV